ncbi:MAG: hypothetical protein FJ100_19365 [Deltaproteobacteria bacterium]|nr:hypothetical protein [Deltaproteobacteria bacterium]
MAASQRFCPICGTQTDDAFCPTDKVATFTVTNPGGEPARFAAGDVVAGK